MYNLWGIGNDTSRNLPLENKSTQASNNLRNSRFLLQGWAGLDSIQIRCVYYPFKNHLKVLGRSIRPRASVSRCCFGLGTDRHSLYIRAGIRDESNCISIDQDAEWHARQHNVVLSQTKNRILVAYLTPRAFLQKLCQISTFAVINTAVEQLQGKVFFQKLQRV